MVTSVTIAGMGLEFSTAKKRATKAKPITFTLDGDDYTFTPPKAAVLAMMAIAGDDSNPMGQLKAVFDWLGNKMPQAQQDRLLDRLRDPDDKLDLDYLTEEVFPGLVQEAYGRPTT